MIYIDSEADHSIKRGVYTAHTVRRKVLWDVGEDGNDPSIPNI